MKTGHIVMAVAVLAVLAALAGCGPEGGGGTDGSAPARAGASAGRTTASAVPSGAPALPGSLPKFTNAGTAEQAMRALIALAAAHAAGLPDRDRHPEVVTTSDFACGVKVAADVCAPTSPDEKVVVHINPEVAWEHFQQPVGHGGGDAPWQNTVLAAYMNYVMFRQVQRDDPSLLTDQSDAAIPKVQKIQRCKEGNVAGPLERIMSSELLAMYTPLRKYPDYVAGAQGRC